jgi:hypothetical protein
MVEYPCPNCGEIFNKKSNFNYHINRKRPCVKTAPELPQTPPELPQSFYKIFLYV